ncbi:putative beta-mannosidase [Metarhizium anisopliae BRIP 53293]|uniref:Beta-mannosidase B n=1 Tax=Metarhizium anisopliae BRIP 53293 TaxID=1291518 RepID=A0A0D9P1S5_METAN|nr:putative beta-mannosidase [Metarhizium anisopliae BRIP 53293]KJK91420.1 putative beta-mannosidase [Metarhizium anisopliae BRIP 53284]
MLTRTSIPINQNWQFKQAEKDDDSYLAVSQFPTHIHLDLLHHKLIPDPYIGQNENEVQWIGETAWTYKTIFSSPETNGRAKAVLAFDGLDTFATVVLNGKIILEADNMFVSERVDVSDVLRKTGDNELVITFDAAYLRGWKEVEKHPDHKWGCWNGDISRLGVRKSQYHWGWDWGPELMTCGPWRPIHLELYESRLADLHAEIDVESSLKSARVVAHAIVEGTASHVRFNISLGNKSVSSETVRIKDGEAVATFKVQNPELWYPIRYGSQPLYTIKATLLDESAELDSSSKRIGLRKVELIQRPLLDQPGTTFFFQVNNIPIFCGGSNWIPADNFIPRISKERYYDWVKMVANGNQFMLRVWGGGIYEEEPLYDACDELGILVWQDFMFGCGNYPAHNNFLKSVEREARQNVKRLRHHPSIVIWAGNNEDYQYAESEKLGYDPKDENPDNWLHSDFPARYIYEKVLPDICRELIPSTYYHPGSPWGGKSTTDPTTGDIHQWNVWHGSQEKYQNFDKLVGRFVSEFGMEAFPSIKTIESYLPKGKNDPERFAQSATVDFHNKAAGHERRLALYLVENIRYAPDPLEYYIYCTQLMQAECIASAYRLWKREWRGPGREYCAGALVWQINDCWPVTSWAICDYYLRPKHAYYTVKREIAPISIGMTRREHTHAKDKYTRVHIEREIKIEIWGSNLNLDDLTADCVVKAWNVETGRETYSHTVSTRHFFPANASTEIISMNVPVTNKNVGEEGRTVMAAYLYQEGKQIARYVNWPEPLKYLHLQKPKHLRAQLCTTRDAIELSAEVPVKGVAVECDDDNVKFDDNLIDIVPGEIVSIGVKGVTMDTKFTTQYLNMLS